MIKVDLITGFLGSGKTTFIKKYVNYLITQGEKVAILENDYGAVNVDMMLLDDLKEDVELEMVAGTTDRDCHQRRFKTKLISLGMRGFDRVIIEPSGLFDIDEFYDVLHEEPLDKWYRIENVICIVNAHPEVLSERASYVLASEVVSAGKIILSRVQECSEEEINMTIDTLNTYLRKYKSVRNIEKDVISKKWDDLSDDDFESIRNSHYVFASIVKKYTLNQTFSTLYYLDQQYSLDKLKLLIPELFNEFSILRIKGFVFENNQWYELNSTHDKITIQSVTVGQDVLIIIGENLEKNIIDEKIKEAKN